VKFPGAALTKGATQESRLVMRVGLPVVFVGAAVLSTIEGVRNALVDSQDMQWSPARLLIHGHDPYKVWLDGNDAAGIILSQTPNYGHLLYFVMAPFAALPWHSAKALWALVNVGFGLGTAVMLCRRAALPWRATVILTSVFALSTPFRNTIGNGQQSLLVFATCAVAVCAVGPVLSGCATAVAIMKYSFAPPLLILLVFRRRAGAILIALFLSAAGVLAFAAVTDRFALGTLWEPLRVSRTAIGSVAGI
jgi:Glycosyltransferase family 87